MEGRNHIRPGPSGQKRQEMIQDYLECVKCVKKSGKGCSTCSWDEAKIGELALCCLMDREKVLEGEKE